MAGRFLIPVFLYGLKRCRIPMEVCGYLNASAAGIFAPPISPGPSSCEHALFVSERTYVPEHFSPWNLVSTVESRTDPRRGEYFHSESGHRHRDGTCMCQPDLSRRSLAKRCRGRLPPRLD